MKRLIVPALAALLLAGCASARQSEFFEHSTVYRNWSHMKFSVVTYKNPGKGDYKLSREEQWWGKQVAYHPQPQGEVQH